MNTNGLAKRYGTFTPEERFKLIHAAGGRGDEAESARLASSAQRITLAMPDYAPFGHAFSDVAWITFAELLDEAAGYLELFRGSDSWPDEALDGHGDGEDADPEVDVDRRLRMPAWQRSLELAYASGYILKVKADGWKLFCERLSLPPLTLFGIMPGFARLERALDLADAAAFKTDGMVRWLNTIRPIEGPTATFENLLSIESYARSCEECFRDRVKWWGG